MEQKPEFSIQLDAFSDSQFQSKLWLCETLEKIMAKDLGPLDVVILGGWYGVVALLLEARQKIKIRNYYNVDLDRLALETSLKINDSVRFQGRWKTVYQDMNTLSPKDLPEFTTTPAQQLWINTSVEHVPGEAWFERIPQGAYVAFQGTDMAHPEHVNPLRDQEDFHRKFSRALDVSYSGERKFVYGDFCFSRFFICGQKKAI